MATRLVLLPFLALPALVAPARGQVTVNAPVAPEAVYAASGRAATPGISVIDLNGFGQGTGDPAASRFPRNPNVGQPGVYPVLAPGTSRIDGGSAGALRWVADVSGSPLLVRAPAIGAISDLQLGQPLDLLFHNERNNVHSNWRNHVNPATNVVQPGNTIMVAPHPNPPRLVNPPPNPAAFIFCEEPTMTTSVSIPGRVTTQSPPCLPSPMNLLVRGNPFSNQPGLLGLFGVNFDRVFCGPQPPPPLPPPPPRFCPYTCRQQIGHFLYAVDRDNKQVVVLNSNTFLVLHRIRLPDPLSMAVSPNLRLLAVSNFATSGVSLIDIDPSSPTTHQVLGTVQVATGPRGLAWQPEGEDLLVCSTTAHTLSVISGATLSVRKTTTLALNGPLEVAVSGRQIGFGFYTGTYFAYVLNSDGSVAVFESGPSVIGPDDIVTHVPARFPRATTIQPYLGGLGTAFWVAHEDPTGLGQVSLVELVSSPMGPLPWTPPGIDEDPLNPRSRDWGVTARIGGTNATTPFKDRFSGNTLVDLAFDDIQNQGGFPDVRSLLLPGLQYAPHSGKGQIKLTRQGLVPAHAPMFLFTAAADAGKVDVFEIASGRRVMTLDLPGVTALAHYWRQ